MCEQHALHLGREDRVAAALDALALSADDRHVAVGRDPGQVAGPEPAVDEDRARLRLAAQVAVHDGRRADQQLADLAGRQRAAGGVDDADLDARDRPADALGVLGRIVGEERDRPEQLGRAIAADDPGAGACPPFLGEVPRAGRRARDGQPQSCVGEGGQVEQPAEHRRHAGEDGDGFALQQTGDAVGREALDEADRAPDEERGEQRAVETERVGERQRGEHDVVGSQLHHRAGPRALRELDGRVREQRALRPAR